jgi:hypothetical protein
MLYECVQPSPRRPRLLVLLLVLALAAVAATPRPAGAVPATPLVSSCEATPGESSTSDCTIWRPVWDRQGRLIGYTVAVIRLFRPLDQLPDAFLTHAGGRVYAVTVPQNQPEPRDGTLEAPPLGMLLWNWRPVPRRR